MWQTVPDLNSSGPVGRKQAGPGGRNRYEKTPLGSSEDSTNFSFSLNSGSLIHKGGPLYIRGEFQLLKMYKIRWFSNFPIFSKFSKFPNFSNFPHFSNFPNFPNFSNLPNFPNFSNIPNFSNFKISGRQHCSWADGALKGFFIFP